MNGVKKILNKMVKDLSKKPDENLIRGYKNAMKDYKETGDEQCLRAAEFIKIELDKRNIEVEE